MSSGPIECTVCGLFLGTGLPGGGRFCRGCGCYVEARLKQKDYGGAATGLILLGAAALAGYAIVRSLRRRN